jgi:hypothetical protein
MHQYDLRIIDYYQPLIAEALTAWVLSLPVAEAATSAVTLEKSEEGDSIAANLNIGSTPDIGGYLSGMRVDGLTTGQHGAGIQLGTTTPGGVDWDNWTPGDPAAAAQAADGGLEALLEAQDITIRSVSDTLLGQLGNAIANGLAAGSSVDSIAGSISDLVDIQSRSLMIAATETARAQIAGALNTYSINGINQYDIILAAGACAVCSDAADANPHRVNDGQQPPLHPFCRCSAAPSAENNKTPTE